MITTGSQITVIPSEEQTEIKLDGLLGESGIVLEELTEPQRKSKGYMVLFPDTYKENMFGLSLKIQLMNKIKLLGIFAFILLGVAVWVQQRRIVSIKKERDGYQMNSDAMLSDMKQWQVDSTTMATDVKINNLEAASKHQLEVNAPIAAAVRDSVVIRDTIPVLVKSVSMITPHIQLSGIIEKDTLIGKVIFQSRSVKRSG